MESSHQPLYVVHQYIKEILIFVDCVAGLSEYGLP